MTKNVFSMKVGEIQNNWGTVVYIKCKEIANKKMLMPHTR